MASDMINMKQERGNYLVWIRAANDPSVFTITEKAPYYTPCWK